MMYMTRFESALGNQTGDIFVWMYRTMPNDSNKFCYFMQLGHYDFWIEEVSGGYYWAGKLQYTRYKTLRSRHHNKPEVAAEDLIWHYYRHKTQQLLIQASVPKAGCLIRNLVGMTRELTVDEFEELATHRQFMSELSWSAWASKRYQVHDPKQYMIDETIMCSKCSNAGRVDSLAARYIYSKKELVCGPCLDHYLDTGVITDGDFD